MVHTGFIKACNFYVSEWHLLAAMLPFVRDELKIKNRVVILSQDSLKEGMRRIMEKIEIPFYNSNGIEAIEWCQDYEKIEIQGAVQPIDIFVQGTVNYIDEVNQYLERKLKKVYREIRIINCYELYDSNPFLYEILDKHDYVFNTGGLKRKEYVFPDYKEVHLSQTS